MTNRPYKPGERPTKRVAQQELTACLVTDRPERYIPGSIFVLSGPEPTKAVEQYAGFHLGSEYLLVEEDKKTYNAAAAELSLNTCCPRTHIFNNDIFKLIKNWEYTSGIDLDLCVTLNQKVNRNIAEAIRYLVHNNRLPCFWLRITSSLRKIGKKNTHYAIEAIKMYGIIGSSFVVDHEKFCTYGDTSPMHTWQGYFINNGYIAEQGEKNMKVSLTQERTFGQLDNAQKEMVRTLMKKVGKKFSTDDIAKAFSLKNTSISALKAHKTMDKRYK